MYESREGKGGGTRLYLVVVLLALKKLDFGGIEHNACAQRVGVGPVANGAEIHDLKDMLACAYAKALKRVPTHFNVC